MPRLFPSMPAWDMAGLVFRKMSQLLSRSAKNSIVEWLHLCDWPLRRVEPAVNWQRQAVQHGCGVAQEKTNDRGDVLTLGKSSERDPGEHWTAFWRDRSRLAYPCRLKRRLGPQN